MGVVYLAVPKRGAHLTRWRNAVRAQLLDDSCVLTYVFHSRHVKVWSTDYPRLKASRVLQVKDRTVHKDRVLLTFAYSLALRAKEKGYSHETAAAILIHYLFNMAGEGYRDEAAFHLKRNKALFKLRVSAKADHGWELQELKKAGLL